LQHIKILGNEFSKLKNAKFSDRIEVTPHVLNNHCCRHPELKLIQQSNLKQSRNNCVDHFRKDKFEQDASALQLDLVPLGIQPTISNVDDEEEEELNSEPTKLANGMYLTPREFLRGPPFFTDTIYGYHCCLRYQ
jgi:hypothetical protein